jgi:phenylacetate-CoA ligase
MRGLLKTMFSKAPEPVVDLAKVAYDWVPPSLRYGKPYRDAVSLLRKTERWDFDTLVTYQEALLGRVINHCYQNVPYYREIFDKGHLKPADIRTSDDLQKLPFLTKEIVRQRKGDLVATDFSMLERDPDSTSGSTGDPLDFLVDRPTRAMEMALALRHLWWLGYEKGDKVAEIKEDAFSDPQRICRYFPGSNHLRFSFFRVDDTKLEQMATELDRFRPRFIKAFPSSLYVLSRWMDRHNRTIPSPKCIITSSENLYPSIKEQAEKVFRAPVIDWYGQNEKVATACQCAVGQGYHIQMEQAVVELIPSGTDDFEIVGTSLQAYGMPFIRYRTKDKAIPENKPCPCGRPHPLISKIVGREGEIIITPEGKIVAPVAMDYAFYHLEEIKEGQIIQEDIRTLRVRIVPWETVSQSTRETLKKEIQYYLQSSTMNILIEEVEEIPRTSRGKRPFIISRLNMEDYI